MELDKISLQMGTGCDGFCVQANFCYFKVQRAALMQQRSYTVLMAIMPFYGDSLQILHEQALLFHRGFVF